VTSEAFPMNNHSVDIDVTLDFEFTFIEVYLSLT